MNEYLEFSEEVRIALEEKKPVVALESTIITHGMPYPENLKTAEEVEEIIRKEGGVPATTAILNGKIKVGLNKEELKILATSKDVLKAGKRDLPIIIAKKLSAGTTVSATMFCAHLSGIKIFVTGGIGGVHRGGEKTFDVSSDLQELARTNIAVVCAGVKAILDLNLTLEYLETHGVPIIGFRTWEFPAFYVRESGLKLEYVAENEKEIAKIIKIKDELGISSGILIANPIPQEYALDKDYMEEMIKEAVKEAEELSIRGKALTPFLLDRINRLTGKKSLIANMELIKNNAKLGTRIAVELNKMIRYIP